MFRFSTYSLILRPFALAAFGGRPTGRLATGFLETGFGGRPRPRLARVAIAAALFLRATNVAENMCLLKFFFFSLFCVISLDSIRML